jgi:hypothetical protein
MRALGVAAAVLASLLLADGASASGAGFYGPWNSTHVPRTITAAGVSAQASSAETYEVKVGPAVSCPHVAVPITVTFSDPSGVSSVSLSEPCAARWAEQPAGAGLDFSVHALSGVPGVVEPSVSFISAQSTPFVYEVSGPAGVIARAALMARVVPPRVIDKHSNAREYTNICVDGKHELHSASGDPYCEVGGSTEYSPGGWPAAVSSKPRYPALTLATGPYWIQTAVEYHFHYHSAPQGFRATGCMNRPAGRVLCHVSWRRGPYAFAGIVSVGEANVYSGEYKYSLRVVRTDLRTHKSQVFASR